MNIKSPAEQIALKQEPVSVTDDTATDTLDEIMETTALTDNKTVMYTSEQVQQMLDMVVRSLSNQGQKSAPVDLDNVINQVTPSDAKITLTVTEAANMLGISLPKMYEIVRMGRIPSIRVGKKIVLARQASHLSQPTIWKAFQKALEDAGLDHHRLHDCRHTFAVNSIRAGDDIKTIQENMGHYSAAFTLDRYGHVTETMRQESANRMQAFIQGMSGNGGGNS